ncbi:hypothetical protein QE152_g5378 [Popillia japonica]|uniref:Uncharacterized protein n=1 Tax=Popillia japonica TaxID=7064 RepID=A0AAW1MMU2_POPJA
MFYADPTDIQVKTRYKVGIMSIELPFDVVCDRVVALLDSRTFCPFFYIIQTILHAAVVVGFRENDTVEDTPVIDGDLCEYVGLGARLTGEDIS